MFKRIGEKIGPFYFTVGGIGDILLCLSGFHHKGADPASIIVWANSREIAKQILDKESFPLIRHSVITHNFLGHPDALSKYHDIVSDPMFRGKFHIPDELMYVSEWSKVKNVFSHYKIEKDRFTLHQSFNNDTLRSLKYDVVHPYSIERDGALKGKVIEEENLASVLLEVKKKHQDEYLPKDAGEIRLVCIGSPKEQEMFRDLLKGHPYLFPVDQVHFPKTIKESMMYVANADHVFSADTWTKTMSGLCGVPTTAFTCSSDMSKLFPQLGYDPSDNIFMNDWGFDVVSQFKS